MYSRYKLVFLGEKIKPARERKGLTQEQLADEVGVSVSFIRKIETLKDFLH